MINVASYCRVSTDKEDQVNSFEAQQRFFREYVARSPDWQLYKTYADEGISGTSTQKRVQFNRMMDDAFSGKFQMILTKEVSRFSRNILDTIAYTRELKAIGIGVVFMSDGFCSLDPDAELRLAIMGSIAQEESRKTSDRVKWGQTRQMERGVVFGTSMLGYRVEHGNLSIEPHGAEIVKLIFYKYGIEKKGTTVIARELQQAGYRTYSGSNIWRESHLLKILKNEKYVGDLIQKKTYTPDYLTHRKKYNRGQEPFVIIRDHHEAIISRDLWDTVQEEIQYRRKNGNNPSAHSNRFIFSGKILCGQCGAHFISRSKKTKSGQIYRRWGCSTACREGTQRKNMNGTLSGCSVGKQIRNDLAYEMFKYVICNLDLDRKWILRNLTAIISNVKRGDDAFLQQKIDAAMLKKERTVELFIAGCISKEDFQQIYSRLDSEINAWKTRMQEATCASASTPTTATTTLEETISSIICSDTISEPFCKILLERMTVWQDGTVHVKLNRLSQVWTFQLYLDCSNTNNTTAT